MTTPDQISEAYEAWHRAVDAHIAMMREVTHGAPLDESAMTQKRAEIETFHETWMEMVKRRD